MTIELNIEQLLSLMDRPAFWVSEGVIQAVNPAAAAKFITPGAEIRSMIPFGWSAYEQLSSGCLYLTITAGSMYWGASATRFETGVLFALDREENEAGLQSYSLAAQELRMPLSQVMSITDQLLPELSERGDSHIMQQMSRMNQGLHRLLRVVGNMSDAANIGAPRMELQDITAVVQEILDHAEPLCQSAGVGLSFENHPAAVYTMLEYQQLERAIYNLLSNALKHTAPGGTIAVQLKRRGNTVYLTVENPGDGSVSAPAPDMLSRFLREPSLENARNGLGLGLPLVRAITRAHHGVFLLEQPKSGGFRATISLPIRQESGILRSPIARPDYAGERDHGLIELSEHLPPEWYLPKNQ